MLHPKPFIQRAHEPTHCTNDPGGSRTRDLRIKSPLLYQLSYRVQSVARINMALVASTPRGTTSI